MSDNIQRYIGIKVVVEGFHNFPSASQVFNSEVKFLEERHRHNFHIEMEIEVFHNDRDQEFILLQREVRDYLNRNYGTPCEFGTMSCESIAEDLMESFGATIVKVSEDDENYAKLVR